MIGVMIVMMSGSRRRMVTLVTFSAVKGKKMVLMVVKLMIVRIVALRLTSISFPDNR
jgi:hypothetical protein